MAVVNNRNNTVPIPEKNLQVKVVNGAVAGLVGVSCVFPIDLVKTRLQKQQSRGGPQLYRGMADCFVKTVRVEGVRGMYKGSGVNLLLISPEKAIKLACNDVFRQYLKNDRVQLPLYLEMLAGGGAGFCQIVITTPMEMLKIQLQDDGRHSQQNRLAQSGGAIVKNSHVVNTTHNTNNLSATKLALDLMKNKGISGIYKGYGATMLRDVPFSIVYFPLFAHFNRLHLHGDGTSNPLTSLMSGVAAGAIAAVSANPMDVIKTRIQTLKKAQGEEQYTGIIDCVRKMYTHEGLSAFYKGAWCRILVIAPLFGIAQCVYYLGVGETILGVNKHKPT